MKQNISIYFNEEKEVKIEEIKEAANGIKEGKLVLFKIPNSIEQVNYTERM